MIDTQSTQTPAGHPAGRTSLHATRSQRQALFAAGMGNALEWYD